MDWLWNFVFVPEIFGKEMLEASFETKRAQQQVFFVRQFRSSNTCIDRLYIPHLRHTHNYKFIIDGNFGRTKQEPAKSINLNFGIH